MRVPNQSTTATTQRNGRTGFTLIELLVVIMLIGIMSSFVLVALAGVTTQAKEDRTRAQIMKIHELLMQQWEEYQYRRVPPTKRMRTAMQTGATLSSVDMAQQRLLALRELMRMEMPTYISDVANPAHFIAGSAGVATYQPARWRAYNQRASQANFDWLHPEKIGDKDIRKAVSDYQQAECLYLILSQIRDADSSALEFFTEKEIGDVDGDGMKEILDGWGNPIRWMLWAPGYTSPLQVPLAEKLEQHDLHDLSQVGTGYVDANFNSEITTTVNGTSVKVNTTQLPRTLYPLVFSTGPDGKSGIIVSTSEDAGADYIIDQNWYQVRNDPYNRNKEFRMFLIGAPSVKQPEAMADDISNHYLTTVR